MTDNKKIQNKEIQNKEIGKRVDLVVFIVLLAAASAVTLELFHRQTLGNPGSYPSDMLAYIQEMQGLDSGYSFPYPIFFKVSALIHLVTTPTAAVALATMLFNSLAIVITKIAFNGIALPGLQEAVENYQRNQNAIGRKGILRTWMPGIAISIITVSLFFISMLYPPTGIFLPGIKFKYLGVFTANPFHNATYMAARPFAVLAFLWYAKLLPVYEKGVGEPDKGQASLWDYILFSLFLLLATMTKPSFTIVLLGAAGLVMLYRMIRSRFKNFIPTIQLGFCFIPTFIDLLYQFRDVFVPKAGEEGGIGLGFGVVWRIYCSNIPLAVCLAIGFPILVLLLNWRELKKNSLYRFAWQLYVMGFAMAFILYERGFRVTHFNFAWGYMYGIFFCHLASLQVLLKETAALISERKRPVLVIGQWLAYLCHVICGILFFKLYMSGGTYS